MNSLVSERRRALSSFDLLRRCLAAAAVLVPHIVRADAPLPPPAKVVQCSASGAVCAESDPATDRTVVRRRGVSQPLWSVHGWHRWLFVSNDGQSLVAAYDGLNLVPANSDLRLEVLRFYVRGKLVRTVRLGDLYADRSELVRTVSHLAWVRSIGVNRAEQLVVELMSGRKVALGMRSGQAETVAVDGQ